VRFSVGIRETCACVMLHVWTVPAHSYPDPHEGRGGAGRRVFGLFVEHGLDYRAGFDTAADGVHLLLAGVVADNDDLAFVAGLFYAVQYADRRALVGA